MYSLTIISTEIVSLIMSFILLYGNLFETRRNNEKISKRQRMYSALVITDIIAMSSDMISWIYDGRTDLFDLLNFATALSLIGTYILIGEFAFYISTILKERSDIKMTAYYLFGIACAVCVLITSWMYSNGMLYEVINGSFEPAEHYGIYSKLNAVMIVALLAIITFNAKILGVHDTVAVYIYVILPVVSSVIAELIPDLSFGYTASTIALLVIYITLQSDKTNQLVNAKNKSSYYASHDELTGLLSRRAYVEKIEELETQTKAGAQTENESNAGVFFADVNGLKFTNDSLGHAAGDELLQEFAVCARKIFSEDEIFRISGDEFVIIIPNISKSDWAIKNLQFENILKRDSFPLACYGTEYGSCNKINELIKKAEAQMYHRKDEFYIIHPDMKR